MTAFGWKFEMMLPLRVAPVTEIVPNGLVMIVAMPVAPGNDPLYEVNGREGLLPTSPPYAATILCEPSARLDVEHCAVRMLPNAARAGDALQPPIVVPSAVNSTVPVGAVPVTVAVSVTSVPTRAGLLLLLTTVVVFVRPPHAAVVKVASPPLTVPLVLAPTARKWYSVLHVRPPTAADTAAPDAPEASGLCTAVAVLP